LHVKGLPDRPDLVLPKYRAVVFFDGCFWHGHACQKGRMPATNPAVWEAKISTNQARDRRTRRALSKDEWRVIRVWECQLAAKKTTDKVLARLEVRIRALPQSRAA
jgi:DNA mismatch endonuclease (patch repair protein)